MESKLLLIITLDFEALNHIIQKEIYQEFYRLIYPQVIYMVKDHAATEDIIQESFLKVIQNVPAALDTESKLKAWLRVVVKNTTYNFLRKNKKIRNEVGSDSVYIYDNIEYSTGSKSTEDEIELKVMSESIKSYLNDLKPEFKALLELRWKQQLSYKEIAEELEIPAKTVKYKLHRAREAIKKRFQKDWGDPL